MSIKNKLTPDDILRIAVKKNSAQAYHGSTSQSFNSARSTVTSLLVASSLLSLTWQRKIKRNVRTYCQLHTSGNTQTPKRRVCSNEFTATVH